MNPDSPQDQIEARLTALLLGELSSEEAAAVRQAIQRDAELSRLYERLQRTIDLVRVASANPIEAAMPVPTPLRLSAEHRQQLLQHFKTVAPKEFSPARRRELPWFVPMSIAALLVALIGIAILLPDAFKAREISQLASIAETAPSPKEAPVGVTPLNERGVGLRGFDGSGIGGIGGGGGGGVASSVTANAGVTDFASPQDLALNQRYALGLGRAPKAGSAEGWDRLGDKAADSQSARQLEREARIEDRPQSRAAGSTSGGLPKPAMAAPTRSPLPDDRSLAELGTTVEGLRTGLGTEIAGAARGERTTAATLEKLAEKFSEKNAPDTDGDRQPMLENFSAAGRFFRVEPKNRDAKGESLSYAFTPPPVEDEKREANSTILSRNAAANGTLALQPNAPPQGWAHYSDSGLLTYGGASANAGGTVISSDGLARSKGIPQGQEWFDGIKRNGELVPQLRLGEPGQSDVKSVEAVGYTDLASKSIDFTPGRGDKTGKPVIIALPLVRAANAVTESAAIIPETETVGVLVGPDEGKAQQIAAPGKKLSGTEQKIARAKDDLTSVQREFDRQPADATPPKPAATAPVPQPEVQTGQNPYSTFSLNVSDVSFKLAAASLEKGVMPEPGSVRSEEFINAFDYRDPEPPPGVPIAFASERARYPFAHNREVLRFSVKTAAQGREPGRPLNIVVLLDNSGSMERADRVRIIHEALDVLSAQLQPQDKISVITFARTARLWVDGVPGNQAGEVAGQISALTPQGGTNLEDALKLAYQTALRHYLANGVNRVVLLTDGAANLGSVDPDALKQKVEAHRKQGIALDCFGIGWEGFNDDLLEVLSRHGDGRYGFINTPEEASTEFAGQLAGAFRVAASDVKVQVEFNPKRVTAYRQIGYAQHQLTQEQFRDNTVDAAEMGAAESGNALYVIEVNPRGEGPLAIVRVRFKVPGTADYREHEWTVPVSGPAVALEQASPALRLAAAASAFSEWLVSSPYAAEVTSDRLLGYLSGVPEVYGADARPKKLEWMIRQAKSIAGK
jgi:Mg-chelatase subunit ChlD